MILAIVGPTGVGKTKLSVALAKKYNAIIINCDAVQVYKKLNIGSAKVTEEEKEGVPHYLIDFVDPNENYSVYDYQKDARAILEREPNKNIIFVGGTGLYLKAALYDYQFAEEKETNSYEDVTNEELYKLALQKDPNCDIHPNNRNRLVRFLNKKMSPEKGNSLYDATYIGLTTNRELLYEKINSRVDKMLESGLLEEATALFKEYPNAPVLSSAIGYKELKKYIEKEWNYEETVEEIKKNSRHYAKRQYTWFKNQMLVNWFQVDYNDFEKTIKEVENFLEKKS